MCWKNKEAEKSQQVLSEISFVRPPGQGDPEHIHQVRRGQGNESTILLILATLARKITRLLK